MKKTQAFGELENQILTTVSRLKRASVKQVQEAVQGEKAYTTIMTVLNRMVEKGLLSKKKSQRHYIYELSSPITRYFFQKIKKWLTHVKPTDLICHFLKHDQITDHELHEIEKMIAKHREEKKNG